MRGGSLEGCKREVRGEDNGVTSPSESGAVGGRRFTVFETEVAVGQAKALPGGCSLV